MCYRALAVSSRCFGFNLHQGCNEWDNRSPLLAPLVRHIRASWTFREEHTAALHRWVRSRNLMETGTSEDHETQRHDVTCRLWTVDCLQTDARRRKVEGAKLALAGRSITFASSERDGRCGCKAASDTNPGPYLSSLCTPRVLYFVLFHTNDAYNSACSGTSQHNRYWIGRQLEKVIKHGSGAVVRLQATSGSDSTHRSAGILAIQLAYSLTAPPAQRILS